jgi:hypothetical protein
VLILLLLFTTRCCPIELVDTRKKTKDDTNSSDNDDGDFNTNDSDDSSAYNNDTFNNIDNVRHFNALYYEDVHLLLIRSSNKGEWDMLTIVIEVRSGNKGSPGNRGSPPEVTQRVLMPTTGTDPDDGY